jgi:4-amino-4-deoxy-L-arabinose transferase-like glycosyltransferase
MTPLALVALSASTALMYLVGVEMFANARFGIVTVILFALTPLLWWQSQNAPASLAPLPLVLGWLLAVGHFRRAGASWWPIVAGSCLGAGVYTSNAAVVMMPVYLLLTIAVVAQARAIPSRQLGLLVAAFVVAVGPYVLSLLRHPEVFRDMVNAHHLYDANRFTLRQGLREMASWVGLTARSEVYYDYFNPAFLFLTGRVLLFPLAVLLPAGLIQIVSNETTPASRLAMFAFFAAPFAASLTADAPTPSRILFITPFAAIVAAYGVKRVLSWRVSFSGVSWRLARSPRR